MQASLARTIGEECVGFLSHDQATLLSTQLVRGQLDDLVCTIPPASSWSTGILQWFDLVRTAQMAAGSRRLSVLPGGKPSLRDNATRVQRIKQGFVKVAGRCLAWPEG